MKLSIIIPCYNESKNIPLILNRFQEVIKKNNIEVILVNNGSLDNSKEVIETLLPQYSFAKSIDVKHNQGYGYGILCGLNYASGDFLGWTHADMQTDPKDVIKALDILENVSNPDNFFIKGTRKNRPFLDCIFTTGMSIFETIYLKQYLLDINAQPNIFSKKFYKTWKKPPYDFSLDLYVFYMAKKQNMNVKRFDVIFPERIYGNSSWNTGLKSKWKFIKRTIDFSMKLKKEGIL